MGTNYHSTLRDILDERKSHLLHFTLHPYRQIKREKACFVNSEFLLIGLSLFSLFFLISEEQLSKLPEVVTLVAYIWEITSLSLGWHISCCASSFCGIPQSVQRAAGRLSEIRARPPYPKSLPICYSLMVHSTV
jgi:hypothetical protein